MKNRVNEISLKIQFNLKVTDEDLKNILEVGLSTGINYWGKIYENTTITNSIENIIYNNEEIVIKEIEDENIFKLNKEKLLKGIKKSIKDGYGFGMYSFDEKWLIIKEKNITIDPIKIDSVAADVIIQYSLFGEIVFG